MRCPLCRGSGKLPERRIAKFQLKAHRERLVKAGKVVAQIQNKIELIDGLGKINEETKRLWEELKPQLLEYCEKKREEVLNNA